MPVTRTGCAQVWPARGLMLARLACFLSVSSLSLSLTASLPISLSPLFWFGSRALQIGACLQASFALGGEGGACPWEEQDLG